MFEPAELLKFRIMMCLLISSPENCNVTGIARTLHEEKYTVSRIMIHLENEGIIDRSNLRAPVLTEKGKAIANKYRENVSLAQNYLIYKGVDEEHAKEDAWAWALYCSDEFMNIIKAEDEKHQVKREFINKKNFTGAELCSKFKDGSYSFPFIIYRERAKGNNNISMANEGFEHPCTLRIKNGEGIIRLKIRSMNQKSDKNGQYLTGKVGKLEFYDSGRFIAAEFNGDMVNFPARALNFINIGSGNGQVLHGSICLKMQCSCGVIHMPESKAFFTILI